MAVQFTLVAEPRVAGHPNRDRAAGYVPAVIYGHGVPPESLRVADRALVQLLTEGGAHRLVQLSVDGAEAARTVVLKEIQHDPVSRRVVHVDFQAVAADERIHADVPLRLVGEDVVAKSGGILQTLLHEVRVACLPADLPDHLEVDVSALAIGQSLTVGALPLPSGVTVQTEADDVVVSVLAPRAVEPEAPAAQPAAAEAAADAQAEKGGAAEAH